METIEINPKIRSKIYVFLFCIGLSFFIDNKIPEKQINLTGNFSILKRKEVILTTENIKTIKTYADSTLLLVALFSIIDVMTRKYKISNITFDQEEGIINKKYGSIDMTHILDFEIQENIFQRIIGVANIRILSRDKTTPQLTVKGISHSDARIAFEFLKVNTVGSMVGEMVRRRSTPPRKMS